MEAPSANLTEADLRNIATLAREKREDMERIEDRHGIRFETARASLMNLELKASRLAEAAAGARIEAQKAAAEAERKQAETAPASPAAPAPAPESAAG